MKLVTTHRQRNNNAQTDAINFQIPLSSLESEYKRTIQMFKEIYDSKGLYFALALLYDSGYTREDIGNMMEVLIPRR